MAILYLVLTDDREILVQQSPPVLQVFGADAPTLQSGFCEPMKKKQS